jgi:hypothetical protein
VTAHAQTLAKATSSVQNVDTIITGHTPVLTWADLREYAEFNRDFVAWAQAEMKAEKSIDEAAAEYKIPEKYKGYAIAPSKEFAVAKSNIEILYKELKR